MKRTYSPSKKRRRNTNGFLVRKRKAPHILKQRKQKGRWKIVTS
jgi:ribosomal protein L34